MEKDTIIQKKSEQILQQEIADVLKRWERGDMRAIAEKQYRQELYRQRWHDSDLSHKGQMIATALRKTPEVLRSILLKARTYKTWTALILAGVLFAAVELLLRTGNDFLTEKMFAVSDVVFKKGSDFAKNVLCPNGFLEVWLRGISLMVSGGLFLFTELVFSRRQLIIYRILFWGGATMYAYELCRIIVLYNGTAKEGLIFILLIIWLMAVSGLVVRVAFLLFQGLDEWVGSLLDE